MKRKRNESRPPVDAMDFIEAWQTSSSVAEVAQKVGRKKNACRVRAFRYRKLGVPLKYFPPVDVWVWDWKALAEFAQEVLDDVEEPDAGVLEAGVPEAGEPKAGKPEDAASLLPEDERKAWEARQRAAEQAAMRVPVAQAAVVHDTPVPPLPPMQKAHADPVETPEPQPDKDADPAAYERWVQKRAEAINRHIAASLNNHGVARQSTPMPVAGTPGGESVTVQWEWFCGECGAILATASDALEPAIGTCRICGARYMNARRTPTGSQRTL